jgi:hypothetical protein
LAVVFQFGIAVLGGVLVASRYIAGKVPNKIIKKKY